MTAALWRPFVRNRWRRDRRNLRAYAKTCAGPHPFIVEEVLLRVSRAPLTGVGRTALDGRLERLIRQILLEEMLRPRGRRAIIAGHAEPERPVVVAAPSGWRAALEAEDIRVAHLRSRAAWVRFQGLAVARGVREFLRLVAIPVGAMRADRAGAAAMIFDVPPAALPHRLADGTQTRDFVSWIRTEYLRLDATERLVVQTTGPVDGDIAGPTLALGKSAFSGLWSQADKLRFLVTSVRTIIASAFRVFAGDWLGAIALRETITEHYVRIAGNDVLPRHLVFHIGGNYLVRPLWTYGAEDRGCTLGFVMYSTNFMQWSHIRGQVLGHNADLALMSWPRILVWSEANRRTLVEAGQDPRSIMLTSAIDFIDSPDAMPKIETPFVAVFDVVPYRRAALAVKGFAHPYYAPSMACRFLGDIADALARHGMTLVLKNKRPLSQDHSRNYRRMIDRLAARPEIHILNPEIAASRIIERAAAVVVMPFSSPALAAHRMGIPSAYYDPSGTLTDDRDAADGVTVLNGKSALEHWVAALAAAPRSMDRQRARS